MKTMLLIDADNVSVGVMEQAVQALLAEFGALHVRRAYCTAESAAKHQAVFKRLGIRPVVNLAAGKNSTDIAMAIDALDLAIAERPEVVAIASSDSDFAPLVLRLREKGCRVLGIGQEGKTGDATQAVYDRFVVLPHRAAAAAPRKAAARTAGRTAARGAAGAPGDEPAAAGPAVAPVPSAPPPAPDSPPKAAPRPDRAAGRTPRAKAAATARATAPAAAPAPAPSKAASDAAPAPASRRARGAARKAAATAAARAANGADAAEADAGAPARPRAADPAAPILAALPELARGETVELRVAAERLRAAGLLAPRGVSTRLFGAHPQRFELLPAGNPQKVRLRG